MYLSFIQHLNLITSSIISLRIAVSFITWFENLRMVIPLAFLLGFLKTSFKVNLLHVYTKKSFILINLH